MSILSGALGIIWAALMIGDPGFWLFGFGGCLAISVVLSILAIVGGIMAMAKRMFSLALIGAICAMLNGGFFGTTFVIGLIALVLIVIGKDAFVEGPTGAPFRF
jgi:hypothetical protein